MTLGRTWKPKKDVRSGVVKHTATEACAYTYPKYRQLLPHPDHKERGMTPYQPHRADAGAAWTSPGREREREYYIFPATQADAGAAIGHGHHIRFIDAHLALMMTGTKIICSNGHYRKLAPQDE